MTARYNVMLEWDEAEQVWVSYVPSLNWLSTFGDTREEALEQTRESILGYLEAIEKEGLDVPGSDSRAELASIEVATA